MVQPQPGCVNLRHAGRTNHHIHHHMTLRPYHSHHTLQKQVRRTTCSTKVALGKPLQRETNSNLVGFPVCPTYLTQVSSTKLNRGTNDGFTYRSIPVPNSYWALSSFPISVLWPMGADANMQWFNTFLGFICNIEITNLCSTRIFLLSK